MKKIEAEYVDEYQPSIRGKKQTLEWFEIPTEFFGKLLEEADARKLENKLEALEWKLKHFGIVPIHLRYLGCIGFRFCDYNGSFLECFDDCNVVRIEVAGDAREELKSFFCNFFNDAFPEHRLVFKKRKKESLHGIRQKLTLASSRIKHLLKM